MDRSNRRPNGGFVLPTVLFISVLMLAGLLFLSVHSKVTAKNHINISTSFKSDVNTQAGLQHGLLILAKRLSYLPDRINHGRPDPYESGKQQLINDTDIQRYATTSPSSFWTEWLNNLEDEPDFIEDGSNSAYFEVDTSTYHLIVRVVSAIHLAPVEAENSAGYNNVTLRYGYHISTTEKLSGRNNTKTIASSLRPEHIGHLIQVAMARELSRYHLFSINNTTRDGIPLYDRTSYTGQVYSKHTFYVAGVHPNEPRYSDTVQISNQASPLYVHKDGISFQFKFPNGSPNQPRVIDPLELPTSSDMEYQKNLAHKMNRGQNPLASTSPGIYVGTSSVKGSPTVTSVYVNSGGLHTTISVATNGLGVNAYTITRDGSHQVVQQNVSDAPSFVIFVDGPLSVYGDLAERSMVTVNARDDIKIVNSLRYESGVMTGETVLGLVSWQGDILVAKDIPPSAGQLIKNLELHGVLMTVDGGFGVEGHEDFDLNYPSGYVGTIQHQGAFIRKWGLPTLSPDGTKGWGLVTQYDPYLKTNKAPPFFPGNGNYKLIDENLSKIVDIYIRKS